MNIMNIIHQSIEKGITIHSIKEGYKFDSSINSQVLAFAFGQAENPGNFLLMHAMGPNVAGVIGSAVAAGVLLNVVG